MQEAYEAAKVELADLDQAKEMCKQLQHKFEDIKSPVEEKAFHGCSHLTHY